MAPTAAGLPQPYHNLSGYTRFIDQDGYPCQRPPWGELTAVNANTGDIVWRTPLGSYDQLEAQGLKNTGASNTGGPIVTAGGLVFIAATTDSKFRAFDARTGSELWVTKIDASGTTVPMTYLARNGKQYVVVAAGGTNRFRMIANTADQNSDALIAFALPDIQANGSGPPANSLPNSPGGTTSASSGGTASTAPSGALPQGEGRATVIAVCTQCHGPTTFSTLRMSQAAWKNEVQDMKDKGAVGTDEDFKRVIDYLARNFPPR
jgi:quinoprotein glucose dehydrogenase